MYQVEYFCPMQANHWQIFTEPFLLIFSRPAAFRTHAEAAATANSLIWRYHSARVRDPRGRIVYQV